MNEIYLAEKCASKRDLQNGYYRVSSLTQFSGRKDWEWIRVQLPICIISSHQPLAIKQRGGGIGRRRERTSAKKALK